MATITPFRGLTYNSKAVTDLADVLAPPYDVISKEQSQALYEKHSRNVIRLILGQDLNANESQDGYSKAAGYLKCWREDGSLVQTDKPAIYLYAQEYEAQGVRRKRVGFICRTKIELLGTSIFPHERTLSGPKEDRLKLTRACKTNFSQVFGLYSDPALTLDSVWDAVMNDPADMQVVDESAVSHAMWIVTDEEIIGQVVEFMKNKPVVIADGHHRYETALNYRNERKAEAGDSHDETAGYNYVMMYLSNTQSQGFTVLPTHRLVRGAPPVDNVAMMKTLAEDFDIQERPLGAGNVNPFMEELARAGKAGPSLGMYGGGGNGLLLSLKKPETLGGGVRGLDVSVLQEFIFEKAMGISKSAVADKEVVGYVIDAQKAVAGVDAGTSRFALLMNSADIGQVMDVATNGEVMPQKSTYFYPKLISGLVFNPLSWHIAGPADGHAPA